ncbi:chromosome segregation and condensation protein ScpB [Gordonia namibiensis NBRC 108229]|uniref:Chromosome segregation and condensation protein ScpB n=1 Tax=Gordonia namibiensis NBRC 108229 TaxID=1208314 RepID=K6XJ23_9ACTN|nr:SMC-Scp complex subunit ScpB [Gordonia namibiensis]GAB98809.1 chromosome segregation and condensation protein ScpB [Gordonia namibiensis NBRC 108229]
MTDGPIDDADDVNDEAMNDEAVADADEPGAVAEAVPSDNGASDPGPADPEQTALTGEDEVEVLDDATLRAALEAVLLVVDTPVTTEELANAVDQDRSRVRDMLNAMSSELTAARSGIDLRFAGDGWRFYTRADYAPYVERLLLDGARSKLTRAALETLAVIAYRQPVTRARVSAIRGVNVDGVIRTLVARGLINEVGQDPQTNATTYATTELFLERLGLASLSELPDLAPLLPDVDLIDSLDDELLSDPRFAKLSPQASDSKVLVTDGDLNDD